MTFYGGDSFHTLTPFGQVGLVALSIALTAMTLYVASRVMRGRSVIIRLLLALGIFTLFVWLSPQVYYAYYFFLFDGLPIQLVIGAPPTVSESVRLLTFTGPSTLSAHGIAILGWALILLVPFRR